MEQGSYLSKEPTCHFTMTIAPTSKEEQRLVSLQRCKRFRCSSL